MSSTERNVDENKDEYSANLKSIPKNYEISVANKFQIVYNFINNEYALPDSLEYFDNKNPATNQVFAKVARSNNKDAENAIKAAKHAFGSWSKTPYAKRAEYLRKIADEIEKNLKDFAVWETKDTGKPLSTSTVLDIPRAILNFRFFAGHIEHDFTHCHQLHDAINYSYRKPVGVCTLITPWNLPLYLLSWKIAPAIAAGNTVVCKPSELSPMTAYLLTKCILASGLPKGVINIIHGYGKEVGEPLCTSDDVQAISFTGGTVTGSRISSIASPLIKKLSLELGGKNATIIFDDCDFDNTVVGACRSAFANQGEICLCGSRIFIQSTIAKKFIEKFVETTKEMYSSKVGDPMESGFGSLISLEHRNKIEYYVDLALKEGGKIILGGERPKHLKTPFNEGAYYMPTIITNLSPQTRCSTEEIFGPVITIHEFDTTEQVIEMANNVKYGLAGSVWTNDLKKGHLVAQEVESGMIWVNCWLYRDLRVPFGGVKQSGIGVEGGFHSMDFWTNTKNICVKYQ